MTDLLLLILIAWKVVPSVSSAAWMLISHIPFLPPATVMAFLAGCAVTYVNPTLINAYSMTYMEPSV
jgi:hypothetical protein